MFVLADIRRKEIPEKPGIYAIYSPKSQKLIYVESEYVLGNLGKLLKQACKIGERSRHPFW
jgi:hypothetical protein